MRWAACVVLTGCVAGAGPVVGYGARGIVLGGEVNAGVGFLHAAAGYQGTQGGVPYLRADLLAAPRGYWNTEAESSGGARLGIGFAGVPHDRVVLAAGALYGHTLKPLSCAD